MIDLLIISTGRPAEVEVSGPFGGEVVEEGGGGGHAAAEDGGGELGGGPEGGGLQAVGFVRVAGAEGDDEAHDGCDAGAVRGGGLLGSGLGWDVCFDTMAGTGKKRGGKETGNVQETDGEDGQDADFAAGGDLEFGDEVEGEEEDGEVGEDVDGGGGDEGGLEVDAAAAEGGVPDAGAGHALEDGGAEVGEVEGEVGPDEEVDDEVGLARPGHVEEPAVHEEDGELGEEDGGAVEHFGGVCELGGRRGEGMSVGSDGRVWVRGWGVFFYLPLQTL